MVRPLYNVDDAEVKQIRNKPSQRDNLIVVKWYSDGFILIYSMLIS